MRKGNQNQNKSGDSKRVPLLPVRDAVLFPGRVHSLQITRDQSLRTIRKAQETGDSILCVTQKSKTAQDPTLSELYEIGTLCEVIQVTPLPDGSVRAVLRATERMSILSLKQTAKSCEAQCERAHCVTQDSEELQATIRLCISKFQHLAEADNSIPFEALEAISQEDPPEHITNTISYFLPSTVAVKQSLLEVSDIGLRCNELASILSKETRLLEIQRDVERTVNQSFDQVQREYYLREQVRSIQKELGDLDGHSEAQKYRDRLESLNLPEAIVDRAKDEISRLEKQQLAGVEASIIESYLDWLLALPWAEEPKEEIDLTQAKSSLDGAHYGLAEVKQRIIEYLAVQKLSRSLRSQILCFVGPPGVGKTSAAESIANAMGRKIARIALGGVRDEAEIRGHRRTYIGAQPGRILKEIRRAGSNRIVILLDEIDKISREHRGDPSSALLEVLDPALQRSFVDHYLDIPFDLSNVVFLATANSVSEILPALRDRMEIVEFSSYSPKERIEIAKRHMIPMLIREHGLDGSRFKFEESAIESIASHCTREPGVRQLHQQLSTVCRRAAVKVLSGESVTITNHNFEQFVSCVEESWLPGDLTRIGQCFGLAVSKYGGVTMPVEVVLLEPEGADSKILLTGNLGDVMRESAQAAVTYLRLHAEQLTGSARIGKDIHVHVGEGAAEKDGPSAGLAVAIALISAAMNKPMLPRMAVTGEIGLTGEVRPVGGLREKLIAAKRDQFTKVLVPKRNQKEVEEFSAEISEGLELHFVEDLSEALAVSFGFASGAVVTDRFSHQSAKGTPINEKAKR